MDDKPSEIFFQQRQSLLMRTYFNTWKRKVKLKKVKMENFKLKLEQREKLDKLVKTLEDYKKPMDEESKSATRSKVRPKRAVSSYKYRFEAQRTAIEKLSVQLEEKDRLIQELKFGILDNNALKEINRVKYDISEIFGSCSAKVRTKFSPPVDYSEKFMISSQKAPKIMQEMEERAQSRAQRRQLILERKRLIDANRKRIIEEALEKKRAQDEEEKKRNLEIIKERRRKELEQEKIRQANKIIFIEKLNKAEDLYNRNLLKRYFKSLSSNHLECKINNVKSQRHYNVTLLYKCVAKWKNIVEAKYQDRYAVADALFAGKIISRTLKAWCEVRVQGMRAMQVAEDFYDLLLLNNVFVHWHRYVCIQYMLDQNKIKSAEKHYNKKIVFHSFYQWRSLPVVLQLEKAKEEKKKKWRQKVWEILPDYKPPLD